MKNCLIILILALVTLPSFQLLSQVTSLKSNENSQIMKYAYFSDELRFDLVDSNQLYNYINFTKKIFENEFDSAFNVLNNLLNALDSTVVDSNLNLPYFYPELSEIESINLSHQTKKDVLNKHINNLDKGNYSIHEKYLLTEYYFAFYCSNLYNQIWYYDQNINVDIDYLSDVLMQCPTFAKIRFFDVELYSIFEVYDLKIKQYPGSPKYIIPKEVVKQWYDELNNINLLSLSYTDNNQLEVFKLSHEIYLTMLKQVLDEKDTVLIFKI